jgi:flagellar biosynthetic protein FliR
VTLSLGEAEIGALVVATARVTGLVLTAPVLGDGGFSARAKLVAVLAIGTVIGLARPAVMYDQLPATALLELGVGALTGASARFVMARVAVAGQLIGLALGLGFAQEYDPRASESAGTIRALTTTLSSLAFLAAGGLAAIVRGAAAPAHVVDLATLSSHVVADAVSAFGRGVAIAAPILLAGIVGNLGLAVMNRAAPGVNVFSFALVAVLALGGLVVLWSAPGFAGASLDTAREAITRLLD